MGACFSGWALDAFDVQLYSFVIPALIATWGMTKAEAGYLGTTALVFSALGGWLAGVLCDRIGRVRTLQLTVLWFSAFTFLSGFANSFEQLLVLRSLQGLGFGGEWAAGAVLLAETIRPEYRGRAAGTVHSGYAVGWGMAALAFTAIFSFLPPEQAWRWMFWIGIGPAILVIFIRRFVKESKHFVKIEGSKQSFASQATAIFSPRLLRTTIFASLFSTGLQGGYYAVVIWLPTYLSTEKHLSILGTGAYLAVIIFGAFCGFLSGAHLADWLGRKRTFFIFAVSTAAVVCLYVFMPISNNVMLFLGFPLGFCANAMYAPTGAFYAELFPTEVRGTGQGFCYNFGRGVGAFFPALVGLLSATMSLGSAIGIYTVGAYTLAIFALFFLPETRGRDISDVQPSENSSSVPVSASVPAR